MGANIMGLSFTPALLGRRSTGNDHGPAIIRMLSAAAVATFMLLEQAWAGPCFPERQFPPGSVFTLINAPEKFRLEGNSGEAPLLLEAKFGEALKLSIAPKKGYWTFRPEKALESQVDLKVTGTDELVIVSKKTGKPFRLKRENDGTISARLLLTRGMPVLVRRSKGGTVPPWTSIEILVANQSPLSVKTVGYLSLEMYKEDRDEGSLVVVGPTHTQEGRSVTLKATHSGVDFDRRTIRVCVGRNGAKDESFKRAQAEASDQRRGSTLVTAEIPDLGINDFIPWLVDDNAMIRVVASNDTEIVYVGEREYKITGRVWPLLIGVLAFAFAWALPGFKPMPTPTPTPKSMPTTVPGEIANNAVHHRFSPLRIWQGKTGKASLSNFQIWLWTLIIFSLAVYLWWATGELFSFESDVLWLLGIAGSGSVAARATAALRQEPGRQLADADDTVTSDKATASLRDLIMTDGGFDLFKLQMLVFTLFTAGYVVVTVVTSLEFPDIPDGLFWLMGISNGTYVAAKAVKPNPFASFSAARAAVQALEQGIAAEQERKKKLDEQVNETKTRCKESQDKLKELEKDFENAKSASPINDTLVASLTEQMKVEQENLRRCNEDLAAKEKDVAAIDAEIKRLETEKSAADAVLDKAKDAVTKFVTND